MVAARKQMTDGQKSSSDRAGEKVAAGEGGSKRPLSNYNYDEAVQKVQEWNEALKCMCYLRYCRLYDQPVNLSSPF